jgi:hypothetical protein
MSVILLLYNLHLGIELLGAIVFFIAAWLFFEAGMLKRDVFSFARAMGFLLVSSWHVFHASYGDRGEYSLAGTIFYLAGLGLVLGTYGFEKLPPRPQRPKGAGTAAVFSLGGVSIAMPHVFAGMLATIAVVLFRRYAKDIDRHLKWLVIGFFFLAAAAALAAVIANPQEAIPLWAAERTLALLGFVAVGLWVWQFISLRIRQEALIVFISVSLFISLLVTTIFSTVLLRQAETDVRRSLEASVRLFGFYFSSLENKALAAAQILGTTEPVIEEIKERDWAMLHLGSASLLEASGQDFIVVADALGRILWKANSVTAGLENALAEEIVAEALEGRPSVTVDMKSPEGPAIRAASRIIADGAVIGVVIVGTRLDEQFVSAFRSTSRFETTLAAGGRILASTTFAPNAVIDAPDESGVKTVRVGGQDVIGAFKPVLDRAGNHVGTVAITTTPGRLIQDAQAMNFVTIVVTFLITISLVIPLYRFTVFLTS